MTRKAVFEIGSYRIKENPTGGWSIYVIASGDRICVRDTRPEAVAVAQMYANADRRHSSQGEAA